MASRTVIAIAAAAAFAVAPVAVGGEGVTLGANDTAAVSGTRITCTVQAYSIRCSSPRATATLSNVGKVVVVRGTHRLFPRTTSSVGTQHLRIGNAEGFFVGATPIFCHVYVTTAKTLSCYSSDPKGGLAGTYGFDLTEMSVVVFRFGKMQDRHDVRTIS